MAKLGTACTRLAIPITILAIFLFLVIAIPSGTPITTAIKTAIIVPDLPQYTYREGKSRLGRLRVAWAKKRVMHDIARLFHYVDKVFLFSEKMVEELDCAGRYMVFEGIATDQFTKIREERLFNSYPPLS